MTPVTAKKASATPSCGAAPATDTMRALPTEMQGNVESERPGYRARVWIIAFACLVAVALIVFWISSRNARTNLGTAFLVTQQAGKMVTGGYSGWVGFQMKVGAEPLNVTALGRMVAQGNSGSHTVKLIDAETAQDVPGGSVEISLQGKPPGQFAYASLPIPITLQPGGSYYLVSSESVNNNTGDFFYDYNSPVQTTQAASVIHSVYWEGGEWKQIGSANEAFGPLDFRYTAVKPE